MNKSVVVTSRINEQLSADLDRLAAIRDRSRAWLIEKAIASFVGDDLALRDALEEANAEIERGEFIGHDEFMAQLRDEYVRRKAA